MATNINYAEDILFLFDTDNLSDTTNQNVTSNTAMHLTIYSLVNTTGIAIKDPNENSLKFKDFSDNPEKKLILQDGSNVDMTVFTYNYYEIYLNDEFSTTIESYLYDNNRIKTSDSLIKNVTLDYLIELDFINFSLNPEFPIHDGTIIYTGVDKTNIENILINNLYINYNGEIEQTFTNKIKLKRGDILNNVYNLHGDDGLINKYINNLQMYGIDSSNRQITTMYNDILNVPPLPCPLPSLIPSVTNGSNDNILVTYYLDQVDSTTLHNCTGTGTKQTNILCKNNLQDHPIFYKTTSSFPVTIDMIVNGEIYADYIITGENTPDTFDNTTSITSIITSNSNILSTYLIKNDPNNYSTILKPTIDIGSDYMGNELVPILFYKEHDSTTLYHRAMTCYQNIVLDNSDDIFVDQARYGRPWPVNPNYSTQFVDLNISGTSVNIYNYDLWDRVVYSNITISSQTRYSSNIYYIRDSSEFAGTNNRHLPLVIRFDTDQPTRVEIVAGLATDMTTGTSHSSKLLFDQTIAAGEPLIINDTGNLLVDIARTNCLTIYATPIISSTVTLNLSYNMTSATSCNFYIDNTIENNLDYFVRHVVDKTLDLKNPELGSSDLKGLEGDTLQSEILVSDSTSITYTNQPNISYNLSEENISIENVGLSNTVTDTTTDLHFKIYNIETDATDIPDFTTILNFDSTNIVYIYNLALKTTYEILAYVSADNTNIEDSSINTLQIETPRGTCNVPIVTHNSSTGYLTIECDSTCHPGLAHLTNISAIRNVDFQSTTLVGQSGIDYNRTLTLSHPFTNDNFVAHRYDSTCECCIQPDIITEVDDFIFDVRFTCFSSTETDGTVNSDYVSDVTTISYNYHDDEFTSIMYPPVVFNIYVDNTYAYIYRNYSYYYQASGDSSPYRIIKYRHIPYLQDPNTVNWNYSGSSSVNIWDVEQGDIIEACMQDDNGDYLDSWYIKMTKQDEIN